MIVSPWPPFEDLQTIWGISYRGWHVVTHTCMWCDQDNDSLTQVVVEQTSSSVCLGNLFFLGASSQSFILYLTSPIWLFFLRLVNPAQVSFDLVRSAVQRLPPPVSRISSLSVSKGCVYFARYIAWWFIVHFSTWFHFRSPQWLLIKRSNPITPFTSKHLMRTRSRFPQRSATNKSIDP